MAERRNMTPADAMWLYSEYDKNHQTVSGVMWTETPVDFGEFRDLVKTRLLDMYPVFGQKAVMSRNPLMMPHWEDDPDFDLDNHVIELHLPEPGTKEQLEELVSQQRSVLLDRNRPLWQFFLIQNYRGGSAVHGRIQHCIADGWALVRLILSLTDSGGAAPPQKVVDKEPRKKGGLVSKATSPVKSAAGKAASAASSLSGQVRKEASPGAVLASGQDAMDETLSLLDDPSRFVEFGTAVPDRILESLQRAAGSSRQAASDVAASATGKVTEAGAGTVEAAKLAAKGVRDSIEFTFPPKPGQTVLHGEVGGQKKVHWNEPVPLDDVKAVGDAFDATVNDVFLGVLTNAFRRYLAENDGLTVDDVFIAMPVSLRGPDEPLPRTLGNKFGLVPVLLPVNIEDPVEQVRECHRRVEEIKKSTLPIVSFGLMSASALTTPEVERQIHKLNQAHSAGVVTNVPGPRHPISLAGADVLGMLGWGGVSGNMVVTIAIFTLNGQLHIGTITDTAVVPDPEHIDELIGEAYVELLNLAGVSTGSDED